ncbi:MAG TPA: hypothetical protein VJB94_05285 [Candidatus Nanoarchaeia archaeon]|nr:hypothetical protein [Candidatus Nanoarchaeia archaeon]
MAEMGRICDICRRNFSSHVCDKCSKAVCEFEYNVLLKACILCAPRKSTVNKSYPMPQGM